MFPLKIKCNLSIFNLTSAKLEFEFVAKLGKLDAVKAQFEIEAEFVILYVVTRLKSKVFSLERL